MSDNFVEKPVNPRIAGWVIVASIPIIGIAVWLNVRDKRATDRGNRLEVPSSFGTFLRKTYLSACSFQPTALEPGAVIVRATVVANKSRGAEFNIWNFERMVFWEATDGWACAGTSPPGSCELAEFHCAR